MDTNKQSNNEVKCLLAGIDTIELGFCVWKYKFSPEVFESLAEAKERARSKDFTNDLGVVDFCGYTFQVNRGGAQRYNYILRNRDIEVKLNQEAKAGKHFPEVHIKFMAGYLWGSGWLKAMKEIIAWVDIWAEVTTVVVSRCDLAVDFQSKLPVFSPDFKELVIRARKKQEHLERFNDGLRLTGYSIGSPMLMCRIYDKLHELKKSDKGWFKELWLKNGWQESSPVMRVEFQCRRSFLRMMQVNSPADLVAQVADLFKYLTTEWLTIRKETNDTHRTRWPINNLWLAIQSATKQFGQLTGVTRLGQMRPRYGHIKSQMRGSLVSLVAISSESLKAADNKVAIDQIRALVRSLTARPEFDVDVSRRRARFAGMEARR